MRFVLKGYNKTNKFYKKEHIVKTNLQRAFELRPKLDLAKLFNKKIFKDFNHSQKREKESDKQENNSENQEIAVSIEV